MAIRAPLTDPPEMRCSDCRVSFPPEVKRCIHCGERTHRPDAGLVAVRGAALRQLEPFVVGQEPPSSKPGETHRTEPRPDEEEAESGARGPLRMASALVWILLALGGGLYRACSG